MKRPLRPMLAIVAAAIVAHLALGFVVGRLQPRPEEMRRTTHVEFESIAEEAMAIRVALEIERMKAGYIDEIVLGKHLRMTVRDNLGMTLKGEGWHAIRIEQGMDAMLAPGAADATPSWRGYSDVRRERKYYTVTMRSGAAEGGSVVTVEEARR